MNDQIRHRNPRVFVSYSHDSSSHSERTLALAGALRSNGIDVALDQFHQDEIIDWPRWCNEQCSPLHNDFVLCICTAEYFARIEGRVAPEKGKGVHWEGALLDDELYDAKGNCRIIPILLGDEADSSIPRFLRGWTYCRIRGFELTDAGYEHLLRLLTAQSRVVKNALGPLPNLPKRTPPILAANQPPAQAIQPPTTAVRPGAAPPQFSTSRLPLASSGAFVGRTAEFDLLNRAWGNSTPEKSNVVCLVGKGGEGKTTLVVRWLQTHRWGRELAAEKYFDWSFYTQGTTDDRAATTDPFFDAALRFFGEAKPEQFVGWARGERLATLVGQHRALLVLDGVEPFQNPPGPGAGTLRDLALRAFLLGVAGHNQGLCILTTRFPVSEFLTHPSVCQRDLDKLDSAECVRLLRELNVVGEESEMRQAASALKGHALALTLLGNFLSNATDDRDIRRWREVPLLEEDAEEGGHTNRLLRAYENWLGASSSAVCALRLLGLFGRPAEAKSLDVLRRKPAIPGLTDAIIDLPKEKWLRALKQLENLHLVTRLGDCVEAHALIREYFAARVRTEMPAGWREAQNRLYEHLRAQAPEHPGSLEQMRPLYFALAHGCAAGRYQECLGDFYRRICNEVDFAARKLGAHSADLVALSGFFDELWTRPTPALPPPQRAYLLTSVSFRLAALGRLADARDTANSSLALDIPLGNLKEASRTASALARYHLLLAELSDARRMAEQGVALADKHCELAGNQDDADNAARRRAWLAHVLYQMGDDGASLAMFQNAERVLSSGKKRETRLKSIAGIHFCGLLLALGRVDEVLSRAKEIVGWGRKGGAPLDIGLGLLMEARAWLELGKTKTLERVEIRRLIDEADVFLRFSAQQDFYPPLLFARAELCARSNDARAAEAAISEAEECSRRAGIKLYLADGFMHRARLLGDAGAFAQGRKLIEEWGYWRWKGELETLDRGFAPGSNPGTTALRADVS